MAVTLFLVYDLFSVNSQVKMEIPKWLTRLGHLWHLCYAKCEKECDSGNCFLDGLLVP
jgi:hypothetical protein